MPAFRTEVAHSLGREAAVERLTTFLEGVLHQYKDQLSQIDGAWNENVLDFSLTTYGFKISGVLTVEEELARLQGELPFAAMVFRGKIEKGIASELERALT